MDQAIAHIVGHRCAEIIIQSDYIIINPQMLTKNYQ